MQRSNSHCNTSLHLWQAVPPARTGTALCQAQALSTARMPCATQHAVFRRPEASTGLLMSCCNVDARMHLTRLAASPARTWPSSLTQQGSAPLPAAAVQRPNPPRAGPPPGHRGRGLRARPRCVNTYRCTVTIVLPPQLVSSRPPSRVRKNSAPNSGSRARRPARGSPAPLTPHSASPKPHQGRQTHSRQTILNRTMLAPSRALHKRNMLLACNPWAGTASA